MGSKTEGQVLFGMVLRDIRIRQCGRFDIVTPSLIAAHLDITPNAYYKYEQGTRRMPPQHLSDLCEFYGHDSMIKKELRDKYAEHIHGKSDRAPLLKLVARRHLTKYENEIQRICYEATVKYEAGEVRDSYEMARSAWDAARSTGFMGRPFYQLAGVLSRSLSQLGQDREAVALLTDASKMAAQSGEPAMHCSLELSRVGCRYRGNLVQGAMASQEYTNVLNLIKLNCRQSFDDMSPQWVWNWCDTYRSRIIVLSITLEEPDSEFLRYLWPEFEQFAKRFEFLKRSLLNVESRVLAASHDPDLALAKLEEVDVIDNFAERSYHAMSRIVANYRKQELGLAIDEADHWARSCQKKGYLNKKANFERLSLKMRQRSKYSN